VKASDQMGDLDISSEINSFLFLTVDLKKEVTLLKKFISSFLGVEWECFLKNEHSGTTPIVCPVVEILEPSGTTAFGVGETLTHPDSVDPVAIIENADEIVKPLSLNPPLKNLKRDLAVERTNILKTKRRK